MQDRLQERKGQSEMNKEITSRDGSNGRRELDGSKNLLYNLLFKIKT